MGREGDEFILRPSKRMVQFLVVSGCGLCTCAYVKYLHLVLL